MAIILSSMTSTGIAMTFCTSIIELVYYFYVLTCPVKDSCVENWVDQFNAGVHAAFSILGCLTFLQTSPSISRAIDFSLIFLLIALTVVNVSLVMIGLLVVVWKLLTIMCRSAKEKKKATPATRVSPVLRTNFKLRKVHKPVRLIMSDRNDLEK